MLKKEDYKNDYLAIMMEIEGILERIQDKIQEADPDSIDFWDLQKIGGIRHRLERVNKYLDEDIRE